MCLGWEILEILIYFVGCCHAIYRHILSILYYIMLYDVTLISEDCPT